MYRTITSTSTRTSTEILRGTAMPTATEPASAPIYESLVEERGDVPAEARETAEEVWREVELAVDFRSAAV